MVAPRMAIMMPLLVSPIFMVEVSTAAISVSWVLGVSGSGWRFNCSVVGLSSKVLVCCRFC